MYILNGKVIIKAELWTSAAYPGVSNFKTVEEAKTIVMDIVPMGRNPSYCQAVSFQFLSQDVFLYKFII